MSEIVKKQPRAEDVIIGHNIRQRRLAAGMSQEKLGELLGITFQQIQKYEKGTNRVGGSRMVQIAKALQCKVEDLFAGVANENAASAELSVPSPMAMEVARLFDDLPYTQRRAFRNLLSSMANYDAPALQAAE